jgi:deoxyguanosine kinase
MLIVVEGCIGAGKSTVAKGLAAHRKSEALFEAFDSNPFLPAFYDDPAANAIETEFTFLLLHFHQLKKNGETILKSEVITDFNIEKDLLYANLNPWQSAHLVPPLLRFLHTIEISTGKSCCWGNGG